MKYSAYVKNSDAYKYLSADAANPASGYLFVGKDGVYNEILFRLFLGMLIGCGEERAQENFADVSVFEGKFAVADAEFVVEKAYYTPVELDHRYFVIKNGEEINEAAQNKLLKVLEEPPRSARFFIMTKNTDKILPTVRSRLRQVICKPLSEAEMNALCDENLPNPQLAAALSGGSIERAERFSSPVCAELFGEVLDMLTFMRKSGDILRYAARINSRREYLADILDIVEIVLRDSMMCSLGKLDGLALKNSFKSIQKLSEEYTADVVIRVFPLINNARERSELNGNVVSIIDEFLFGLLEVKAKCRKL